MSAWCEHCRGHFDEDHYNDEEHLTGYKYGPTGYQMALVRDLYAALKAVEHVWKGSADVLPRCPTCHASEPYHLAECQLAAALKMGASQ